MIQSHAATSARGVVVGDLTCCCAWTAGSGAVGLLHAARIRAQATRERRVAVRDTADSS